MPDTPRRPTVFRIDDPNVVVAAPSAPPPEPGRVTVTPVPEPDEAAPPVIRPRRRWLSWSGLFWGAVGGIVSLALGLALDALVRDLFARADWLGWLGLALVAIAVLALGVMAGRELASLWRLARIDRLRADAAAAAAADDASAAKRIATEVAALYSERPETARARGALAGHLGEIIDGRDIVVLAERELMRALDTEARRLVLAASKRVSVITALSPRALVDLLVVAAESLRLMRRLATLYGGRPGTLGFLRLARTVLAHLAVTGGMAMGDSLVEQLVGHGLAAKLSARLGEGVVNGLMTARVGLAAIDVCRPLPFIGLPAPTLRDVMGDVLRRAEEKS